MKVIRNDNVMKSEKKDPMKNIIQILSLHCLRLALLLLMLLNMAKPVRAAEMYHANRVFAPVNFNLQDSISLGMISGFCEISRVSRDKYLNLFVLF
jgi:hypothetical protein